AHDDAQNERDLYRPGVPVRVHAASEVVVNEPAGVRPLTTVAAQGLFPGRERAVEVNRDAHQRNGDRSEMERNDARPAPGEETAAGHEYQVRQMQDEQQVSERDEQRLANVVTRRLTRPRTHRDRRRGSCLTDSRSSCYGGR